MKTSTLAGLAAAVLVVLAISYALSGAAVNATLMEKINPVSTLNGLAFAFAFGGGVPLVLAFVLAAAVMLLPALATFRLVTRLMEGRAVR